MTANLIRGRISGEGVKDILLDENQSLKVVQCDEDGEVLGDGTPLKVVLVDGDGDTLTDDTNDALKVVTPVLVIKEAFDEGDLSTGVYTATATYTGSNIGFGIYNNSTTNIVTFTIGTISIPVAAGKSFYGLFTKPGTFTITIAGTSPDFDAFIEG